MSAVNDTGKGHNTDMLDKRYVICALEPDADRCF